MHRDACEPRDDASAIEPVPLDAGRLAWAARSHPADGVAALESS